MICLVLDSLCKRSNKLSDSIKGGKFLKHLGERKLFFYKNKELLYFRSCTMKKKAARFSQVLVPSTNYTASRPRSQ